MRYLKLLIIECIVFAFSFSAKAQTNSYTLNWEDKPSMHLVHNKFADKSAVVLLDSRLHEFKDDAKLGVLINVTDHKLIKINDEKGVEIYNKVYIPVIAGAEVISIKARTILPGGKIIDLPQAKILDVEEEGHAYKKFAFEGVEKGSEVEYISVILKKSNFFGIEYYQSSNAPTQRAEFTLVVPSRLVFDVKGFYNFKVVPDTVINEQRIVKATQDDIPALEEEKYSVTTPNTENIQYKLSYNTAKDSNVRVFTWNELAKNIYNDYTTINEKEVAAADAFLKEIKIPSNASETEKICLIEDYIKNNINTGEDITGTDVSRLDKIIKSRNADNEGTYKLYIALFNKLNIPFQIVFPSKRNDLSIQESFENYRLINEMIFSFPSTGKFLEPANKILRYPFIDPYWAATKGLFLKGTSIGTFKTAIPFFDTIAIEPYEKNYHNLEAVLKINASLDTALIYTKQIWLGYGAMGYRPGFVFLPKDKINDYNKEIVQSLIKADDIENIKVENAAFTNYIKEQPLTVAADIKSPELLEKAGNKLLVKFGEIIGPQAEMYQEKPRQLPMLLQYPHALDRNITFVLPAGYQVKNLNDLNFNVVSKTNGAETMGFISTYTLSGNQVKVNVHEFYKVLSYPLTQFEDFKRVINASADFNKVTLVLEKNK